MTDAKIIAFPGCSVTELEAEAVEQANPPTEPEVFDDNIRFDYEGQLAEAVISVEQADDQTQWLAAVTSLGNLTQFIRAEVGGG
jgi:hypothetical protein